MVVQRIATGTNIKLVTYSGNDFMSTNRSGLSQGATFTYNGVDVSAGCSSLYDGTFTKSVTAQMDEAVYLTDETGNTYFQVLNYLVDNGTTRPTTS